MNLYRHELKYFIHPSEYQRLKRQLGYLMKKDSNAGNDGLYHIRSLYFDTPWNTSLQEKLAGVLKRKKYRIRFYNHNDQFIRLEQKNKEGDMTRKVSMPLSRDECDQISNGNYTFLLQRKESLAREFYNEINVMGYKPVVIVDYLREAYIHSCGNVRITFDKTLQTGRYHTDLFSRNIPVISALEADQVILEIKYDSFLPASINNLLHRTGGERLSISKYALCRK